MKTFEDWICARIGASSPLTRQALEAQQLHALNETLAYARAHSPFYRARLPEGKLTSLEALSALPFTTPDDLRQSGRQMLCVKPDAISRIVTLSTSGSTGMPKRVYFTPEDQERTIDYFHHGMATLIAPGSTVLILFPGSSPGSLNDLLMRGLERMGCMGIPFGFPTPERYEELCAAIEKTSASCLVGSARSIAGAAKWSLQHGRSRAVSARLNTVLLAADFVPEEACAAIRSIWSCTVHEHYGSTESGLGGALSCSAHHGYHIQACDLYVEIIDPCTLQPVPFGCQGELVFTTLTRKGMPFIRYRTGDRSRFLPGPCSCGSIVPRIDRVESRPQPKKFQRPDAITF